jgi:NAD(P)-dependent dehydrogenase (short-subunit alcohol dehydrogenase family)
MACAYDVHAMDTFVEKTAVITGAASGIGFALAERFAAEGARVMLADIEAAPLEEATARLRASGAEVGALPTDVSDAGQVERFARATAEAFGPVHVLCNNAGVGKSIPMAEMTNADWSWMLDVNVWGVINGLQAFLPGMREHGQPGHIVNTASMAGMVPGPGMAAYCASKSAVISISECLELELVASNSPLGVSVLCPGLVNTRVHLSERNRPDRDPAIDFDDAERVADAFPDQAPMDPGDVARFVTDAIAHRQLYVFTHPEWVDHLARRRFERILAAAQPASDPPE